jgi:hypothetical protein
LRPCKSAIRAVSASSTVPAHDRDPPGARTSSIAFPASRFVNVNSIARTPPQPAPPYNAPPPQVVAPDRSRRPQTPRSRPAMSWYISSPLLNRFQLQCLKCRISRRTRRADRCVCPAQLPASQLNGVPFDRSHRDRSAPASGDTSVRSYNAFADCDPSHRCPTPPAKSNRTRPAPAPRAPA